MALSRKPKLKLGDVVGDRYRIDGVVGRGGFGAVYRARHLETGDAVALKVLLKNFGASKTDAKRFRREAALVQKLRHPKIVQLLDFGYTDRGQPFIAFELLQGEAMSRVVRYGVSLTDAQAAAVASDVLQALAAAHAFGVIHRDIKPGNIFVLADGSSKVLDFGIAKAVTGEEAGGTQLTEAGQMIGTPHYMAPEQVRGTGVVPATDLYSLGLVLAELVSGKRVIAGNALIDVYMAHIADGPVRFRDDVRGSPLWPVIDRATRKDLADRYPSAEAMAADVAALCASLPGPVEVAAVAAEDPRPAPERRAPSSTALSFFGGPSRRSERAEVPPDATSSAPPESFSPPPSEGPPPSTETGTLLMEAPENVAAGRAILAEVARATEESRTINMSDAALRQALEAEQKSLSPVVGAPAAAPQARSPHGAPRTPPVEKGEPPPGPHEPTAPDAAGSGGGGGGVALLLLAVAVVALAAAALLLIGPWSR